MHGNDGGKPKGFPQGGVSHFSNSTNVQGVGFQGAVQFSETIQRRFWHGLPGGSVDDTHKFKKSSVWPTSGSNSREKTVLEWCPVF